MLYMSRVCFLLKDYYLLCLCIQILTIYPVQNNVFLYPKYACNICHWMLRTLIMNEILNKGYQSGH